MPKGRPKGTGKAKNGERPLPVRQQKFIEAMVKYGDPAEAVMSAGYKAKNKYSARSIATKLFQSPRVQSQIQERIREMFPELEDTALHRLNQIVKSGSDNNAIKAISLIAKLFGWEAPSKKIQAKIDVNKVLEKYKLPE